MTDMHIQVPIGYDFIRSKEKYLGESRDKLNPKGREVANTRGWHFKLREEAGVGEGREGGKWLP